MQTIMSMLCGPYYRSLTLSQRINWKAQRIATGNYDGSPRKDIKTNAVFVSCWFYLDNTGRAVNVNTGKIH